MNKVYNYIYILLLLSSCQPKSKEKSIDDIIESKNALEMQQEKTKLLKSYNEISSNLTRLEKAISDLDTTKTLPIVSIYTVDNHLFKHYFTVQGNVETKKNIMIYPELPGILNKVLIKDGDKVEKGQLLASIDDGGLIQQLAQANVQLDLKKTTFERQENLWNQKIGSEIQYLQAKANYQAQERLVRQLKDQLEKTNIRAPFSGIIDDLIVEQGQVVSLGQPIIHILNLDKMYVRAEIPETYLNYIKKGTQVHIYIPSIDYKTTGTVSLVGNYINPNNRTFNIEVNLKNTKGIIKPNLVANLEINDYTNPDALLIPNNIAQENAQGEKSVYIIEKINQHREAVVHKQNIETGYSFDDEIEVIKGLKKGDVIVDEGSKSMRDGIRVKIE